MAYSVAVTKAGQMTIPKVIRDALGIADRVVVDRKGDKIIVQREKSLIEKLEELDAQRTPEQIKAIQENAGKTANQLRKEFDESPAGLEWRKKEYDIPF